MGADQIHRGHERPGNRLLDTNRPPAPRLVNGFAEWKKFGFGSLAVEAAAWRGKVLALTLSAHDPAAARRGLERYCKKWETAPASGMKAR